MNLPDLKAVTAHEGPFVTLYLPTGRTEANAGPSFDLLWKDVARDLADAGVDAATVAALADARGSHTDGGTVVLVAAGGRVLLREALPEATDSTVLRVAPLPHLLPLLGWAQRQVPHVVALVDRRGGDVLAYSGRSGGADGADGADAGEAVGTRVAGAEGPIHKTGLGGWAEQRYQRNVENSWDETAHSLAGVIANAVEGVGARVVLLGGDTREVGLVRGALGAQVAPLVVEVNGGRADDGGAGHLAAEVDAALAAHVAGETAGTLQRFAAYRGRATKERGLRPTHPRDDDPQAGPALQAADGAGDTVAALRMGAVDTLLVRLPVDTDRTALVGDGALALGLSRDELAAIDVRDPAEVLLVDALTRAALAQDAAVVVLDDGSPEAPTDGVGALLRYSLPAA